MPHGKLSQAARVLPKAAQQIWLRTLNQALEEGHGEDEASMMAWSAVERAGYSKGDGGKWSKSMDFETDFTLNDDGSFELGVPLMKIDVKRRIVGGFATLDNLDQAGDILDANASQDAFGNWFGNIREMHEKKAVGRAIDWRPDTYTDPETGNTYDGIWVEAKISKGAEDTWQKVLDGTLAGFSVGGATQEKERVLHKDGDKTTPAWKITKYRLTELSLVDNPCNRLATISLIKSVDGDFEVGETIADEEMDKAYNGESGDFVDLTPAMDNVIKALESWRDEAIRANADDVVADVSRMLSGVRSNKRYEAMICDMQDQQNMDKSDDKEDTMTDEQKLEKDAEDSHINEESATTEVNELSDEERGLFRKFIDFVKGEAVETVEEPLNKEEETIMDKEELTKAIDEKVSEVSETLTKSADEKFEQIAESLKGIGEALEKVATGETVETLKSDLEAKFEALAERVDAIENSGAISKSGDDAGKTEQKIEKGEQGFWGDSFLPEYALRKG